MGASLLMFSCSKKDDKKSKSFSVDNIVGTYTVTTKRSMDDLMYPVIDSTYSYDMTIRKKDDENVIIDNMLGEYDGVVTDFDLDRDWETLNHPLTS